MKTTPWHVIITAIIGVVILATMIFTSVPAHSEQTISNYIHVLSVQFFNGHRYVIIRCKDSVGITHDPGCPTPHRD